MKSFKDTAIGREFLAERSGQVTSDYKGYTIHHDRGCCWFVYRGEVMRAANLAAAMQIIDVLIADDARHADPIVEV